MCIDFTLLKEIPTLNLLLPLSFRAASCFCTIWFLIHFFRPHCSKIKILERERMKRQDSERSFSSSRREKVSSEENQHAKSIGCMSGIFELVCKYQTRRKFLTFGRKQEKNNNVVSSSTKSKPETQNQNPQNHFPCNVPRSPTLPPDIRRSSPIRTPEFSRALESPETTAEKRRKLLGALEKCDEDLRTLKRIIEAVESTPTMMIKNNVNGEVKVRMVSVRNEDSWIEAGNGELVKKVKKCLEFNSEQPSPISVLDEFTRSPWSCDTKRYTHVAGRVTLQQQKRKPKEDENIMINHPCIFNTIISTKPKKKLDNNTAATLSSSSSSSSSAVWSRREAIMRESVEEACNDIAWGLKREVGRIGLALQDYIFRDLIEEIVQEEMGRCYFLTSLPFDTCRRRLCF